MKGVMRLVSIIEPEWIKGYLPMITNVDVIELAGIIDENSNKKK